MAGVTLGVNPVEREEIEEVVVVDVEEVSGKKIAGVELVNETVSERRFNTDFTFRVDLSRDVPF